MAPRIRVEDRDGGLRVITLDNPQKRNALDDEMLADLAKAVAPKGSAQVRVLLVQGEGPAFCAGYDLSALGPAAPKGALPDEHIFDVFRALADHPAPSVALVRGPAIGAGCELACACDFRVGSTAAVLCMPPAKLGVVYSPEGLWRLANLVGVAKAKLMFLTARRVPAATALAWGLLDEVWNEAERQSESHAVALCTELAAAAPLAVSGMKRSFRLLSASRLGKAERAELDALRRKAFNSEDVQEGLAAFLDKRPPEFRGK